MASGPSAKRGENRAQLIATARELFAVKAYNSVTVREIAAGAGCDPGMISYYFGSKIGLFREAMALPGDPIRSIVAAFGKGGPGAGQRVVATVLDLWEVAAVDNNFRLYVAALLTKDENFDSFITYLQEELVKKIASKLKFRDALLRVEIALGQVLGLCYARYLYGKEPLASYPKDILAARYGAIVDATLFSTDEHFRYAAQP